MRSLINSTVQDVSRKEVISYNSTLANLSPSVVPLR
jgi:hypothetical protein